MTCRAVRNRLSAYRDRELAGAEAQAVEVHLRGCGACEERWRSLGETLDLLAEAPRLTCPDGIASRVLTHLEVESRGPGLALLYRPMWADRPFMLPSLLPAALLLLMVVSAAVFLSNDPGPLPPVATNTLPAPPQWVPPLPSWGTETNPLVPSDEVAIPRGRAQFPAQALADMSEGTVFVQTVVARDGSVATVTFLDGDRAQAGPLLEALRRERFVPGRFRGQPVAVSVYRLISRMEVRAPIT
jgi:Putative zinc-finger/Gram-negative bacterial TonB protein C-terminal